MPSIIEVDTIKNKTGTQNTVLSTDGSGNNTLNAGVIKSNTGSNTGLTIASDGQITVNQNNPTITLGSNATFPTGALIKTTVKKDTSGDADRTATTSMVAKTYTEIGCTVGNTIIFSWDFHIAIELTSSSSTDRTAYLYCYQHTSSVTGGISYPSDFGTLLNSYRVGRNLTSSSGSGSSSMQSVHIQAAFEATASTHHLGLVFNSGSSIVRARVNATTNFPLLLTAYEFQGDVLT